jgi:CubicO group peptidase (beta-lactamase class C family)
VQAFVSVDGNTLLNAAFGEAAAGISATSETIMLWRSAGKPLTAAGILRLAEQGVLSVDDPLSQHVSSTLSTPFERVTLAQILSHTTGMPVLETLWPSEDWDEILAGIVSTKLRPRGGVAAYQPQATWFLLGEVLRIRCEVDTFSEALRALVLSPLNINRSGCGLRAEDAVARQDLLPELLTGRGGELCRSPLSDGRALHTESPGANIRGPISDLALFYDMLLNRGRLPGTALFLDEKSVELMTRPYRLNTFDQTLQHKVDMGLGCITNSRHHGPMVPYGFGRFSSSATFGHGGAQCSMGFCDPAHRLVVAWAANGLCSEPQHQRRNRAFNEAVYLDLELSGQETEPLIDPGRNVAQKFRPPR